MATPHDGFLQASLDQMRSAGGFCSANGPGPAILVPAILVDLATPVSYRPLRYISSWPPPLAHTEGSMWTMAFLRLGAPGLCMVVRVGQADLLAHREAPAGRQHLQRGRPIRVGGRELHDAVVDAALVLGALAALQHKVPLQQVAGERVRDHPRQWVLRWSDTALECRGALKHGMLAKSRHT